MNKSQLVEDLMSFRPDLKRSFLEEFGTDTLNNTLTIERNRGGMVAQRTGKEGREVFIARRSIEHAIVDTIVQDVIRRDRNRINTHLRGEREAAQSDDRRAIVRELSEFHLILGEISANDVLSEILSNLMVRSSLIVALYQRNEVPSCQCDEHQAIIDALEAGVHGYVHYYNHERIRLGLQGLSPVEYRLRSTA